MRYSEPRPLIYSKGIASLKREYTEREVANIQKTVRKWRKPSVVYSEYYHVTDKKNVDSIFEHGLLPNRIDGCVFLTKNEEMLPDYVAKYKIENPVVLVINGLKLDRSLFRQSFASQSSQDDVVYLKAIKPDVIQMSRGAGDNGTKEGITEEAEGDVR